MVVTDIHEAREDIRSAPDHTPDDFCMCHPEAGFTMSSVSEAFLYCPGPPRKSKKAHPIALIFLPNPSHFPSPFLYKGPTDGCGSVGKQVLGSCIAVHVEDKTSQPLP